MHIVRECYLHFLKDKMIYHIAQRTDLAFIFIMFRVKNITQVITCKKEKTISF